MKKIAVRQLTTAAMVGAAYAVLAIFGAVFSISYGPIQCRFSEALCILPFLFPETAWGLGVGCLIANILSPYGLLDIIVGSMTTLIAAHITAKCRSRYLAPLPPVILNALLVGFIITFQQVNFSHAFALTYLLNALSVALGEAIACYGLGLLLLKALEKKYHR